MNEETNRPSDVAEAALADTVANKVEAAYRLGKVREKLRVMMADWANYRDERKQGAATPARGATCSTNMSAPSIGLTRRIARSFSARASGN
ncbi:hypothetical protein ACT17R_12670 [Sphingopyxis sp. Q841]|uniref:hypothetical protein n=1 Tax=Sphingopyxis sp. Q841 TaxID=3458250 RepID=UPI004035CE7B